MHIAWGSLGLVAVVALAAAVAVVALVSFALVGLSARERARTAATATPGGPHDGAAPPLSGSAGTAVAAVCLTATAVIVLYGLAVVTGIA